MIGYIAALGAAVFASSKDLVSKKLSFEVSGTVSAFASFAFAIPFYLILLTILYMTNLETFAYKPQFFYLAFMRALTDVGAESFKMLALSSGEISLVSQFLAFSPLFLIFTSPWITHDPITLRQVVGLCVITLSSLLVAYKPRGHKLTAHEKKAIGYALLSAAFFSFNSSLDRLAVQEASATMSAFVMTLLSGIVLLPISFAANRKTWGRQLWKNRGGFSIRGLLEVIFMTLKMVALQYLQVPVVIILQRFAMVFTVIGGRIFYKDKDFKRRLIASLLVIVSGALVLI